MAEGPSESRDGTGAGDRDLPFEWGHPRDCLTLRMQARLTIMRGYVMDIKDPTQADTMSPAEGDVEPRVIPTPSGILVPAEPAHWIGPYWRDEP